LKNYKIYKKKRKKLIIKNRRKEMNQSRELAIKNGFKPGEDIHFIWALESSLEDLSKDIKHHQKKMREYRKDGKHSLAYDREKTIEERALYHYYLRTMLHSFFPNDYYYCIRCGVLDLEEVTFDERCDICGGTLPIGGKMKTVKSKDGRKIRVSDDKARNLVLLGDYEYCPKKELKEGKEKND